MSLARDLVELEAQLRERGLDLFSPRAAAALAAAPEIAGVRERVDGYVAHNPIGALRLCLQALLIQHTELRPHLVEAELVATLPPGTPGTARPTERVVREMIDHAASEIVILGYEFTEASTVAALGDAANRGADVIVICDRARGASNRVLDAWPRGAPAPRVFQDRERDDGAPYASMHAKCLLVDRSDLLVTSANFTFHGLHGNIEIGLRLSGGAAGEAWKIFSYLVETGAVEAVP